MRPFILQNITIELTRKCNLKCIHCYLQGCENREQFIPMEKVIKILKEASKLGTIKVVFTGGEPTLHPHFCEILAKAKEMGFAVSLLSNLYNLQDVKLEAIKLNCYEVGFSLYWAVPDVHDKITGVRGSFFNTIKNVNELNGTIERTIANVTILKENIKHWGTLKDYFNEQNLSYQLNFRVFAGLNGEKSANIECMIGEEDIKNVILDYKISPKKFPSLICKAGRSFIWVDSRGFAYPCVFFPYPIGNLEVESLEYIWNNSQFLNKLRSLSIKKFTKCSNCDAKYVCEPCMGENYAESGNFTYPSKTNCRIGRYIYGVSKLNENK